jgi:predicted alpha/beta superfamily hydrolase
VKRARFLLIAASVAAMVLLTPSFAQAPTTAAPATPITIGEALTIQSAALDELRQITIYLPDGYASGTQRYPVLYLIDGGLDQDFLHIAGASQLGSLWGRSSPAIIIGIATRDRRKELTGPTIDPELLRRYPTAGGSTAFRRFIAEDIQPLVTARYRTNGDTAVLGESLAGLFIIETWLTEPGLFQRYAAISPSLWWDNEAIRQTAADRLAATDAARPPILIATENEGADHAAIGSRFLAVVQHVDGLCIAPQTYNHANIYHAISPMALQFLFPPTQAPEPQFGFEVSCSPKS